MITNSAASAVRIPRRMFHGSPNRDRPAASSRHRTSRKYASFGVLPWKTRPWRKRLGAMNAPTFRRICATAVSSFGSKYHPLRSAIQTLFEIQRRAVESECIFHSDACKSRRRACARPSKRCHTVERAVAVDAIGFQRAVLRVRPANASMLRHPVEHGLRSRWCFSTHPAFVQCAHIAPAIVPLAPRLTRRLLSSGSGNARPGEIQRGVAAAESDSDRANRAASCIFVDVLRDIDDQERAVVTAVVFRLRDTVCRFVDVMLVPSGLPCMECKGC